MTQRIGNSFFKPVRLDLIPGVVLPPGVYQVTVVATLINPDDPIIQEIQNCTWHSRSSLEVDLGDDVYSLIFTVNSLNSTKKLYKHFAMLKSDLIMLNLASKLVK